MIQSLQLLGLGMGSVFVILILLIAIISIVSKIVPPVATPSGKMEPAMKKDHIVAISAAIKQYRKNR